jgi:glyoxylase-like metal-dependent hydrolase (beta-lactamase superfamily II)
MKIKTFFDKKTFTLTYIVYDPNSKDAVVIDPVWDYDPITQQTSTESISQVCSYIFEEGLKVHFSMETHAHADHLSGSQLLKDEFPEIKVVIGVGIIEVQKTFKQVFSLPTEFPEDGSQFDRLLTNGEKISAGSLLVEVIATPGHTPACVSYLINDALFTGDTIFMPDYGTGRCDFPAGSADSLYDSITSRIYSFSSQTRIFVGHDYQPNGREVKFETTVGDQKTSNVQLNKKTSREDFVNFRKERDKGLRAPRLLFQSVQVNIAGGDFPETNAGEKGLLKIPVNVFRQVVKPDESTRLETLNLAEV